MKQAVIQFQGHQYLVKKGQVLDFDRCPGEKGDKIKIKEVLLTFEQKGRVAIGNPHIKRVTVDAEILNHFKGRKIDIRRYKAKSRYRRLKGFRPSLTKVKIKKING